jgi:hypothetical protein
LLLDVVDGVLDVAYALPGIVETALDVVGVSFCSVELRLSGFDLEATS